MRTRIFLWLSLFVISSLLLFTPSVWAADFPEISTSDLKNKLDAKEGVFFFNSGADIEFNLENIPGSVNIPTQAIQTTDKLPQNKETLIVVY